jgi:hypothetical protein
MPKSKNIKNGKKSTKVVIKTVPKMQQSSNKSRKTSNPRLSLALGLEGILNPFLPEAQGLKLPDQSSYPTLPFHVKTISSSATGATGSVCYAAYPYGSIALETPVTFSAGGAAVWNAATDSYASANNWSNYSSSMGLYRTVTGGVKVVITSSLLNTQGRLYVCHVPMDCGTNSTGSNNAPTTVSAVMNMPFSEEYSLAELCEEELIIPFRRYSDVSEHFRDSTWPVSNSTGSGFAEEMAPGWCAIYIMLVGASTTNVVSYDLEHIIICEGLELATDTILATSPAAPFIPRAMEQIYQVNGNMPIASITKDPEQGTWVDVALRKTKNSIEKAVQYAGFAIDVAALLL